MAISNPDAANELSDAFAEKKQGEAEDLQELDATRQRLEGGPEPADDAPKTVSDAADSDADTKPRGFVMTKDRRVGSMTFDVGEHEAVAFGKPNGRASMQIMSELDDIDDDEPISVLAEWIWATLSSWSVNDAHDVDWWADETSMKDAFDAVRTVAMGGNLDAQ